MTYETIDGEVIAATAAAVLIDTCSGQHWVPKSVIENGRSINEFSEDTEFEIAEWFVEEEGLY